MTLGLRGGGPRPPGVGRATRRPYAHPKSRHDYTQPQLFALLAVRQALRTDYRGIVALAAEWRELRAALGLRKVPHYSTLCYAARRLLKGGPSAPSGSPPSGPPSAPASPPRRGAGAAGATPPRSRSTPPGSRRATSAPTTRSGAAPRASATAGATRS